MAKETTYYKYLIELFTTEKLYDLLEDLTDNEKKYLNTMLRKGFNQAVKTIKALRVRKEQANDVEG